MTEYWFSDEKTGFKTMFTAQSEEDALKLWTRFLQACHFSKESVPHEQED